MKLLISLIPTFIFLLALFVPTFTILKYFDYKTKSKVSPLNTKLLRNPGHSLQEKINDLTWDLMANLTILPVIPTILYITLLNSYDLQKNKPSTFIISVFAIIITASLSYFSFRNYKILTKRNKLRLGLECEVAVGQELHNKLLDGFKIFHDFPANQFNIDHIVIGPSGIFAIETKGRAKFIQKENRNWEVSFDGNTLKFPSWHETKPIRQVKRQAVWLEKWIKKSTNEDVVVIPVLALPGWYINRTANSEVLIYNGKNPIFLANRPSVLTEKQIRIISFQVENTCRNVDSISYKKNT